MITEGEMAEFSKRKRKEDSIESDDSDASSIILEQKPVKRVKISDLNGGLEAPIKKYEQKMLPSQVTKALYEDLESDSEQADNQHTEKSQPFTETCNSDEENAKPPNGNVFKTPSKVSSLKSPLKPTVGMSSDEQTKSVGMKNGIVYLSNNSDSLDDTGSPFKLFTVSSPHLSKTPTQFQNSINKNFNKTSDKSPEKKMIENSVRRKLETSPGINQEEIFSSKEIKQEEEFDSKVVMSLKTMKTSPEKKTQVLTSDSMTDKLAMVVKQNLSPSKASSIEKISKEQDSDSEDDQPIKLLGQKLQKKKMLNDSSDSKNDIPIESILQHSSSAKKVDGDSSNSEDTRQTESSQSKLKPGSNNLKISGTPDKGKLKSMQKSSFTKKNSSGSKQQRKSVFNIKNESSDSEDDRPTSFLKSNGRKTQASNFDSKDDKPFKLFNSKPKSVSSKKGESKKQEQIKQKSTHKSSIVKKKSTESEKLTSISKTKLKPQISDSEDNVSISSLKSKSKMSPIDLDSSSDSEDDKPALKLSTQSSKSKADFNKNKKSGKSLKHTSESKKEKTQIMKKAHKVAGTKKVQKSSNYSSSDESEDDEPLKIFKRKKSFKSSKVQMLSDSDSSRPRKEKAKKSSPDSSSEDNLPLNSRLTKNHDSDSSSDNEDDKPALKLSTQSSKSKADKNKKSGKSLKHTSESKKEKTQIMKKAHKVAGTKKVQKSSNYSSSDESEDDEPLKIFKRKKSFKSSKVQMLSDSDSSRPRKEKAKKSLPDSSSEDNLPLTKNHGMSTNMNSGNQSSSEDEVPLKLIKKSLSGKEIAEKHEIKESDSSSENSDEQIDNNKSKLLTSDDSSSEDEKQVKETKFKTAKVPSLNSKSDKSSDEDEIPLKQVVTKETAFHAREKNVRSSASDDSGSEDDKPLKSSNSSVPNSKKKKKKSNTMKEVKNNDSENNATISSKKSKRNPQGFGKKMMHLRNYIIKAGIRVQNYQKLLEGCRTEKGRQERLLKVLTDHGMKGTPTLKKCQKIRKKIELKHDIQEIDISSIINTGNERPRRCSSFLSSVTSPADDPEEAEHKAEAQQRYSRLLALADEDSD